MKAKGVQNRGQAYVRESLWQTRYNTSTWQYAFLRKLNAIRKKYKLQASQQTIYIDDVEKLIFSRTPDAGSEDDEVWVYLNNKQNWSAHTPKMYCHGPAQGAWMDALTGEEA